MDPDREELLRVIAAQEEKIAELTSQVAELTRKLEESARMHFRATAVLQQQLRDATELIRREAGRGVHLEGRERELALEEGDAHYLGPALDPRRLADELEKLMEQLRDREATIAKLQEDARRCHEIQLRTSLELNRQLEELRRRLEGEKEGEVTGPAGEKEADPREKT